MLWLWKPVIRLRRWFAWEKWQGFSQTTAVVPPPVVAFIGTPLFGNNPLPVHLTDLSTNSPTAWDWTLTGQTTATVYASTVQNPLLTITVADVYDVELQASNSAGPGTPLTKIGYITVLGLDPWHVYGSWEVPAATGTWEVPTCLGTWADI